MRVIAMLVTIAASAFAFAQSAADRYPQRAVRWIVPFPPGGPSDILARAVGQRLGSTWNQPVVIENRPGAGTIIGLDAVAKSDPDGYTLGLVSSAFVINPSLHAKLPYDTVREFAGITQLVVADILVFAHPAIPAENITELIALARSKPGALAFASTGSGTSSHLAGEMLKSVAGIDLTHVPYKGSAPAITDVISGRVALLFDVLPPLRQHLASGKLKAIGNASNRRNPWVPNAAPIAQALPGFDVNTLFGVVTQAAVAREIVRKINADIVRILGEPEMKERVASLGVEPVGSTPEAFDAHLRAEIAKWAAPVKSSGAKPD